MTARPQRAHYPERLQLRVPSGFSRAVAGAADVENVAAPEYLRRVILAALASEGVKLPKAADLAEAAG